MTPTPRLRLSVLLLPLLLAACAGSGGTRDAANDAVTIAPSESPVAGAATFGESGEPAPTTPAAGELSAAPAPLSGGVMPAADADGSTDAAMPAGEPPTQAELDYAAIYGATPYDPVADPTLPAPAQLPASYDPWEKWNRKVHRFNNAVDRTIATPLARAYVKVVPRPVRLGVGNFFNNLGQPVSALNALLQGRPGQAGQSLGRFLLNSTLGIGGLFDPASAANIPNRSEDFGQTLGVWGWKNSRYVELPLFGPRTLRDTFGLVGDAPLSPIRQVEDDGTRIFLQGLQLVDLRTQLFALDGMREGATDEYALVRDAWLQRRNYQIQADRRSPQEDDDELPDYLREDHANPTVPVDVMPVVPLSPTP
ncbi:VacJ family lipoprotein [Luteimonas viscosa]|uniref:VacJ family lipoprotein n=1 Tax=Luteimonas viscosa TaxID=1132694 RepID=A0A5D4XP50_9GAMM|nr:VacJ family lipoprotein [Luteimonas viscosa]TYT26457.1 VacJ family lipoprotein [Luteimonas viscosa]